MEDTVQLEPSIDYLTLTEDGLVQFGLEAGRAIFRHLRNEGALNGDSLAVRIGDILEVTGQYHDRTQTGFGDDYQQFAVNLDPETGKLATVHHYELNSATAYRMHGDAIPDGPQRWTGGVIHVAQVQLPDGRWLIRKIVVACSGVQGPFDQVVAMTIATTIGAAWELRQKDRLKHDAQTAA